MTFNKRWLKLSITRRQYILFIFGYLFGLTVILLNNKLILNFKQQQCLQITTKNKTTTKITTKSNLLMVGIMTADSFVETRAITVWHTWAKGLPGKLLFFVGETLPKSHLETIEGGGMPLIRLNGVDDVYPPQKKSFAMLHWMYDNYVSFNISNRKCFCYPQNYDNLKIEKKQIFLSLTRS